MSAKDYLQDFTLVGGTALALQLGHRKSIDLDFFTRLDFSPDLLLHALSNDYRLNLRAKTTLSLVIDVEGIKVDCIKFRYPFMREMISEKGIRMLNIEDIAPMKLDAIAGRGSKKDFYDIYFLLRHYSLMQLFDFYKEMYSSDSLFQVLRSLVYFADAEFDPEPIVFEKKLTWKKVKAEIIKQVQSI
jgi:predicted nucleotidyltransferase component of viral defense system